MMGKSFVFAAALLTGLWSGSVSSQDPCTPLAKQAAQLLAAPEGRSESLKAGKNTVCEAWSKDSSVHLSMTVEPAPKPSDTLKVRRMLAERGKDPGQTLRDEPTLGPGAFSLREKDTLSVFAASASNLYSLVLVRDSGLAAADDERIRVFVKGVVQRRPANGT